jgi:hypothetical protein
MQPDRVAPATASRRTGDATSGRSPLLCRAATERAVRNLNTAAAILATGVVTDSAAEHYRAGFHNRAMFVAPMMAAALLATTTRRALNQSGSGHVRTAILGAATLTGLVGFGFHLANISRRTGGWNSSNIFFGAPIAAPLAVTMAGLLGIASDRVSLGSAASRVPVLVGGLATLGLLGTSAEAGGLHFRGAFQNPFMYAPVVAPPSAAAALATAMLTRSPRMHRAARVLLRLTSAVGVLGVGFHAWGVHRRMGGWRNWRQNLFAGPPLPAPPAFTGLALAALAALDLLECEHIR